MSEERKDVVTEEVTNAAVTADPTMEQVLPSEDQPVITMKKLLEAGAHFGHQTRLWNPKMKPYIFGARNNVHIIDLEKSIGKIEEAYRVLREIVTKGGKVLFVGTRKQHAEFVKIEAERSGSFYINNRWLGGTLTNFKTISLRVKYLRDLEMQDADGSLDRLPKKEAVLIRKEIVRLSQNFAGIKEMRKVPEAIFLVSPLDEANALAEAKKLNIPVFALADTNCDPTVIDYPIPSNDDASKTVQLMLQLFADAIVEAKGGLPVVAYTKDLEPDSETLEEALKASEARRAQQRQERGDNDRRMRRVRTDHSDKPTRRPRPTSHSDKEGGKEVSAPKEESAPVKED